MNTLQMIAAAVILVFLLLVSVVLGQNLFGTGTDFGLSLFERAEQFLGFGRTYPAEVDFTGTEVVASFDRSQRVDIVVNGQIDRSNVRVGGDEDGQLTIDVLDFVLPTDAMYTPVRIGVYPTGKYVEGETSSVSGRELLEVEAVVIDFKKLEYEGELSMPVVADIFLGGVEYTDLDVVVPAHLEVCPISWCGSSVLTTLKNVVENECSDSDLPACLESSDEQKRRLANALMCRNLHAEEPVGVFFDASGAGSANPGWLGIHCDPMRAQRVVEDDEGNVRYGVMYR